MERPLTKNIRPNQEPLSLKDYEKAGGYQAVRKALGMTPQQVQDIVKASNLRGRGGAGFPTGAKWSFVPMGDNAPKIKYLVVNADEMEPGTFKDRLLLEGDPHQIIEGVITSAYAIQAGQSYIFHPLGIQACRKEAGKSHCRSLCSRVSRKEHPWLGIQPRTSHPFQRRPLHLRRGNSAVERSRRKARNAALQAALPAGLRPLGKTDDREQCRDHCEHSAYR